MSVAVVPSDQIPPCDRAQLEAIVERAFEVRTSAASILEAYIRNVDNIVLVRDSTEIVAFQFYQSFEIDGMKVHHLSLAAKHPGLAGRGAQKRVGHALVRHAMTDFVRPVRPFALVGVCNNPKTYANFLAFGDQVFPDVRQPAGKCAFADVYAGAAARLKIGNIDLATGLIPGRCEDLGLAIRTNSYDGQHGDPVFVGYERHVSGNFQTGVFTMVSSTPLRLAAHLLRRALTRRGSATGRSAAAPPVGTR